MSEGVRDPTPGRGQSEGASEGDGVGDERRRKSGLLLLATKAEGDSAASLERARVCAGVQVCVFVCVCERE